MESEGGSDAAEAESQSHRHCCFDFFEWMPSGYVLNLVGGQQWPEGSHAGV